MKEKTDDETLRKFGKGKKKVLKQGGRAVIYQRVSSKGQEDGFSPKLRLKFAESGQRDGVLT